MRGRGRKTDPTTCTRGQATAASAIDSASRIFRWREAAIIHERCHYARKPYAIASAATPRNRLHSPLAEIKGVCSSIIILLESSSLGKTSLEPCPMKKKSQTIDRPSRLHFTVYLFNHDYPLNDQVYSGRIKRFLRRKASDFKREHRKLTARPSDQGVARSSFLSCFLTCFAHQDLIFFRVVSWFHFKDN